MGKLNKFALAPGSLSDIADQADKKKAAAKKIAPAPKKAAPAPAPAPKVEDTQVAAEEAPADDAAATQTATDNAEAAPAAPADDATVEVATEWNNFTLMKILSWDMGRPDEILMLLELNHR